MTSRSGRGWAYAGAALGGAVSVAANVAHSFVPPPGAAPTWKPMHGAVLGAVFWPIALFVAIEILARTSWPRGLPWKVVRLGGLLPVAVVAAVVSYRHLSGLLRYYGEDSLTATFGPLAVDGLMAVASAAIIASAPVRSDDRASSVAQPDATEPVMSERTVACDPPPPETGDAAGFDLPEPTDEASSPTAAPQGSETTRRRHLDDARAYVRAEIEAGRTPSGAAVGRRFGRNSRWGQRMVRDVLRNAADLEGEQASPTEPELTAGTDEGRSSEARIPTARQSPTSQDLQQANEARSHEIT